MTERANITNIVIVDGLEMNCINRCYSFGWGKSKDGYEVTLFRDKEPRRMALCQHKNDAESIYEALVYAKAKGAI